MMLETINILSKCQTFLLLSLLFNACEVKYHELKLVDRNPMSYVFKFSIDTIKARLKINWEKFSTKEIEFASDSNIVRGNKVLRGKENINDAYIYSFWDDTSLVYVSSEEPLLYYAEYHLHLTASDSTNTYIEVRTVDSHIITGKNFLRGYTHVNLKTVDVPPSSIEEYKILLIIGEILGVKDSMPKLKLPKPNQ